MLRTTQRTNWESGSWHSNNSQRNLCEKANWYTAQTLAAQSNNFHRNLKKHCNPASPSVQEFELANLSHNFRNFNISLICAQTDFTETKTRYLQKL